MSSFPFPLVGRAGKWESHNQQFRDSRLRENDGLKDFWDSLILIT
jgi:hypothetical protein